MWALPLNPGQPLAIWAEGRCGIEVCAFGEHVALCAGLVERYQAMNVALFFHSQYLSVSEAHIAVVVVAVADQLRRRSVEALLIQLLVDLVDEHNRVVGQAKRTTAVFVHPATYAETLRCQALCLAVMPAPDTAGSIFRAVFVPEQPGRADGQFCEIYASSDRLGGAESLRI